MRLLCRIFYKMKKNHNLLLELYTSFFKIGILTFGGGLAMLPMLKRELVDSKNWITEEEILDMYAIGQCTPGIIAVNTATFVGYKKKGFIGGVISTLGMISPSIVIICLIASVLRRFIDLPIVLHAFAGIRVAVCAMMLQTVITMAKKGIKDKLGIFLFLAGFLIASFTPVPLAAIVIASACIGILAKRREGVKS